MPWRLRVYFLTLVVLYKSKFKLNSQNMPAQNSMLVPELTDTEARMSVGTTPIRRCLRIWPALCLNTLTACECNSAAQS